ncbi:MAG TPA: dihydrodipicolinate synthase family protein [Acidimicrobiales bacterium]
MDPLFSGVGVALVTLFHDDGSLDAPGTASLAVELVSAGVRAVVVAGSTGEAASLSLEERVSLLAAVRAAVTEVPVIAGTGAPSGRQAAALSEAARDGGADALLVLSPPGPRDPRLYYDTVAKAAGGSSVLAYHFPQASLPGIPVDLLPELPVAGCKDSSGDPERLLETVTTWDAPLYTGSSALLSMAGQVGCRGAILALANAEPELCAKAFAGDASAQLALVPSHLAARAAFPRGIKELTGRRFDTSAVTRTG